MEPLEAPPGWMVHECRGGYMHEASQRTLDGLWPMAPLNITWHSFHYSTIGLKGKFLAIPSFLQDVHLVMDFRLSFKKRRAFILPFTQNPSDDFQTPPEALDSLLPFLHPSWTIWEPAAGEGNLVNHCRKNGFTCWGTDMVSGHDFLIEEPVFTYDCIVTNPPYSPLKDRFLARCYALQKPFALLIPLTALEGQQRQTLYRSFGVHLLLLPKRVHFQRPCMAGRTSCYFAVAWYTWQIMPEHMV